MADSGSNVAVDGDEIIGIRFALVLVSGEQGGFRPTADDEGQFPCYDRVSKPVDKQPVSAPRLKLSFIAALAPWPVFAECVCPVVVSEGFAREMR